MPLTYVTCNMYRMTDSRTWTLGGPIVGLAYATGKYPMAPTNSIKQAIHYIRWYVRGVRLDITYWGRTGLSYRLLARVPLPDRRSIILLVQNTDLNFFSGWSSFSNKRTILDRSVQRCNVDPSLRIATVYASHPAGWQLKSTAAVHSPRYSLTLGTSTGEAYRLGGAHLFQDQVEGNDLFFCFPTAPV